MSPKALLYKLVVLVATTTSLGIVFVLATGGRLGLFLGLHLLFFVGFAAACVRAYEVSRHQVNREATPMRRAVRLAMIIFGIPLNTSMIPVGGILVELAAEQIVPESERIFELSMAGGMTLAVFFATCYWRLLPRLTCRDEAPADNRRSRTRCADPDGTQVRVASGGRCMEDLRV